MNPNPHSPTPRSPLASLVRIEILLIKRSPAWWAICLFCTTLIAFTTLHGAAQHRNAMENRSAMLDAETQRLASQQQLARDVLQGKATTFPWTDPTDPERAGSRIGTRYAEKTPYPLEFAIIGQSDLLPPMLLVSTNPFQQWAHQHELENPTHLLHGRFDLGFVIVFLFPLAAILLGSTVISRERDRGTLDMIRSQGMSLRKILLLKISIRWFVFNSIIVAALILFSCIAMPWQTLTTAHALADIALLCIISSAYILAWFCIGGIAISYLKGTGFTTGILATTWLALLVFIPAILNLLFTTLAPTPSRFTYVNEMRAATDSANAAAAESLHQFYHDHPEFFPGLGHDDIHEYLSESTAVMLKVEQHLEPVLKEFEQARNQQNSITNKTAILAFPILIHKALNDLAGTGSTRHDHFLNDVAEYHEAFRHFFFNQFPAGKSFTAYDEIPDFTYAGEPQSERLQRILKATALTLALPILLLTIRLHRCKF